MPDYSKTVIYKIVCRDLNVKYCYIGHTTNFTSRKDQHKRSSCKIDNHTKLYKVMHEHGGWDNWQMLEIEKFPCGDLNEATARERLWYEEFGTLNSVNPSVKKKEYSWMIYPQRFNCVCGSSVLKKAKCIRQHKQSLKHKTWLQEVLPN
jgi:hypothetical protein